MILISSQHNIPIYGVETTQFPTIKNLTLVPINSIIFITNAESIEVTGKPVFGGNNRL
jgi:hypothetical protein